jgi:hypothetical protein
MDTIPPRTLRAISRVSLDQMAAHLRVSVDRLRELEATPIRDWAVLEVQNYCRHLGLGLQLVVTGRTPRTVLR